MADTSENPPEDRDVGDGDVRRDEPAGAAVPAAAHRFLVRNNLPLMVSYLVIGLTLAVLMFGVGRIMFATAADLRPKLPGYRQKLESFLLALAFWAWIWGLAGAILAIPLVVTIKIILEHIEATRPIALLLSGDPTNGAKS